MINHEIILGGHTMKKEGNEYKMNSSILHLMLDSSRLIEIKSPELVKIKMAVFGSSSHWLTKNHLMIIGGKLRLTLI